MNSPDPILSKQRIECEKVYRGWDDTANPDDTTTVVRLDRTTHRFGPSLRELVLIYDRLVSGKNDEFGVGAADHVEIEHVGDDLVRIDLAPVEFKTSRERIVASLEDALRTIFRSKDEQSSATMREEGLRSIQHWIDERGAETDVQALYERLIEN
jgi:hypothetical protein